MFGYYLFWGGIILQRDKSVSFVWKSFMAHRLTTLLWVFHRILLHHRGWKFWCSIKITMESLDLTGKSGTAGASFLEAVGASRTVCCQSWSQLFPIRCIHLPYWSGKCDNFVWLFLFCFVCELLLFFKCHFNLHHQVS